MRRGGNVAKANVMKVEINTVKKIIKVKGLAAEDDKNIDRDATDTFVISFDEFQRERTFNTAGRIRLFYYQNKAYLNFLLGFLAGCVFACALFQY